MSEQGTGQGNNELGYEGKWLIRGPGGIIQTVIKVYEVGSIINNSAQEKV